MKERGMGKNKVGHKEKEKDKKENQQNVVTILSPKPTTV